MHISYTQTKKYNSKLKPLIINGEIKNCYYSTSNKGITPNSNHVDFDLLNISILVVVPRKSYEGKNEKIRHVCINSVHGAKGQGYQIKVM